MIPARISFIGVVLGTGYLIGFIPATKEIREIPVNQMRAEDLYVRFDVEEWMERDIPIVPRGYGIQYHILTHWDLFKQAVEIPELSLKSEEQYRLWRELRRVDQQLSVILKKKWLDKANDQEIEYQFMSATLKVNLASNQVLILVGVKSSEVSIADVRYRPKKIMNMIERLVVSQSYSKTDHKEVLPLAGG
jgi:hypothetical protein